MRKSQLIVLLAACAGTISAAAMSSAVLSTEVLAQTGPRQSPGMQQPVLRDDEQIMPSQIVQPPGTPAKPKAKPKPAPLTPPPNPDTDQDSPAPVAVAKPATPPKPAEPPRIVTCSNAAFAKASGHLRLAQAYGVHNVEYTQVAGDDGSTLMASVLFPTDPKRRLEILWDDENERSGTRMIVIDGQSTWSAEKGLRLGMPIAALEKLNGKPFKLMGFAAALNGGMAIASDWNGGALDLLGDGCKVGVQFKPDAKATPAVIDAASSKEFLSSDAAIRAAKPTIGEIIVAY